MIGFFEIPFLSAKWENVVVVNFEVDPSVLKQYIPKGTELSPYDETHFVSLVGFLFKNTKFLNVFPIIPFQTFEEINLRFYIKRNLSNEVRQAVCFIKEIVPYEIITLTARNLYNENYCTYPTKHTWDIKDENEKTFVYSFEYNSKWNEIKAVTEGKLKRLKENSFESYILEHYWGYSSQKDGSTKEYKVYHPSWKYWDVKSYNLDIDFELVYGTTFSTFLSKKPHSVFVAEGSKIFVSKGKRIA